MQCLPASFYATIAFHPLPFKVRGMASCSVRGFWRLREIADITNPVSGCQTLPGIFHGRGSRAFAGEAAPTSAAPSGRACVMPCRTLRRADSSAGGAARREKTHADRGFQLDRQFHRIVESVVRATNRLSKGEVADSKITLAQGRQQTPLNFILCSHLSKQSKSYFMPKGTYPSDVLNSRSCSVLLSLRRCL